MKNILYLLIIAFVMSPVTSVKAINAVASIKATSGDVRIQRLKRNIPGRRGLILNDRDVVITGFNARTTILFRDGSEIRLFQNSRFTIEKTEEMKGEQRGFINNFLLKAGSFWGKFTKNRQRTRISTPTATCGIKGTSVSFSEKDGKLDVSLSTGLIELYNEDEKLMLPAGKMIKGIERSGTFKEKIQDLPYRLVIAPDNRKIDIPTVGNTGKIDFTIQVTNVQSKQNVSRPVDLFFSLRSDKIIFPKTVRLNDRGYARVTATIKPFQKADYGNGKIEIEVLAEGEKAMDIGTGQTLLTFDVPKKHQKIIRIDAGSGQIN